MTIQFRSRIKPAIDYSSILNSYGVCCGITGSTGPLKSFIECFNEGGHFVPIKNEDPTSALCPDVDIRRGCCCSCSYVTPGELSQIPTYSTPFTGIPYLSSGTRSNVSKCECDRIGGKWTEGECPSLTSSNWQSICVNENQDARSPRACCHLGFDEDTGWPTEIICTDVCTSVDCANLGTDVYPSVFTEDKRCGIPPLNLGDPPVQCQDSEYVTRMALSTRLYQGFEMGSCYELELNAENTYEYTCSITPESICTGYWIVEQDENNPYCTSSYQPENPVKSNNRYLQQTMSLSDFSVFGLTSGDEFQGGIYIGIFKPSPLNGESSTVRGNINFGNPSSYKFTGDTIGGTFSQWAIIVDSVEYTVPFLNADERDISYNTSLWDGYYNTYGDNNGFYGIQTALTKTIANKPRKGFLDYYLPSIYELSFYCQYLYSKNQSLSANLISSSIFNSKYLNSSTSKNKINNKTFVYGHSLSPDLGTNNYKNVLIYKKNTETALFFRRIILT
jgi:hypothetical protein